MSAANEQLRQAVKTLARPDFTAIVAVVQEVDREKLTCDVVPVGGGADIFDVRLRAATNGDRGGLVLMPKVGSVVVVATINNNWNSAYLALVSEVDSVTIKTAKESLKQWLKDVLTEVRRTTHTSPGGETKPPTNAPAFQLLENRLDNLFLD